MSCAYWKGARNPPLFVWYKVVVNSCGVRREVKHFKDKFKAHLDLCGVSFTMWKATAGGCLLWRENVLTLSKPMNKAGMTLGSTEGARQKKIQ